jgi:hypothetical protein
MYQNPVQAAMAGAALLDEADRINLRRILSQAVDNLRTTKDALDGWRSIADAMNVAEALAYIGICSDGVSRFIIAEAQGVLGAIQARHKERGSWTLYAVELQTLANAVERHMLQLEFCSMREYQQAAERVRNKVRQALAGNAGPGVQVIEGQL